ncbi:hypothetical protein L0F63_007144, partial [Massospora cicadina]
ALGFTCKADAANATIVPLTLEGIPIPLMRTQLPADTTMVVAFARLPTHLPPAVLHQELIEGLAAYGSNPKLQFVVPNGATHLAEPQ